MNLRKDSSLLIAALTGLMFLNIAVADPKGGDDGQPKEVIVLNTDAEPVPVAIQGAIQVDVQSQSSVDVNSMPGVDVNSLPGVDINSMPNVNIQSMPSVEVFNGDHPALTPFVVVLSGDSEHTTLDLPLDWNDLPEYCEGSSLIYQRLSGGVNVRTTSNWSMVAVLFTTPSTGSSWYQHILGGPEIVSPDVWGSRNSYYAREINNLIIEPGQFNAIRVARTGHDIEGTLHAYITLTGYCFKP